MFGTHLSRLGSVHRLGLVHKAIGILRKYGTDAHIYLPGIGTVNGLTADNYLDSAGTTAASVDNPVGLSLDALQAMTLGTNLAVNGTFTTDTDWTKAANWSIAGGVATSNGSAGFLQATVKPLTVGRTYLMTFTIKRYVSGAMYYPYSGSDGVAAPAAVGTYTCIHQATATDLYLYSNSFNGDIDDVIAQEIPGVHARQATTANKPILRLNSGKYSWQFDGSNDYLSLGAPLFQMSDDHCVIAGFKADAANKYIFSQSHSGTATQCCSLRVDASGYPGAVWIDDAPANALPTATTSCIGLNTVATAIKIGNAKRLRVNGVQAGATNNTALGVGTTNSYSIGCLNVSSCNFQGSIYPVIAIKGTVSDADLLTLERFVGQLSGVSI